MKTTSLLSIVTVLLENLAANFNRYFYTIAIPWRIPSTTNVQLAPCQIPTIKNVRNIPAMTARFPNRLYFIMNGLYIKSLHQDDKEMCQRRQNSEIFFARKGRLKLSTKLIPNIFATPKAISVYPENRSICILSG
jgi:hypothetical protein